MGLHYQRAGTQYLLMTAQISVEEYSAANHMGEPGKLQIRQHRLLGNPHGVAMPRKMWRCLRGDKTASDLKPPVMDVVDVANPPQNVWREYPRPEQLPEN